ncbi:hypothetical protein B0H14DRAFT_2593802 [Mycena olivaceomarginata]|nr:hypothetical protein B0H14DRAFT_2593802 [Mycena olivaceomarginata]
MPFILNSSSDLFTVVVLGHNDDSDTSGIRLFHMTMVIAGLLGGEVYITETTDTPELQAWWKDILLPKYDASITATLGKGTKLTAWYLKTLGINPAYQGQGVGKLLVNTIIEKSHATGTHPALCVVCTTETNIKIYTKIGFKLMPKDNTGPDS